MLRLLFMQKTAMKNCTNKTHKIQSKYEATENESSFCGFYSSTWPMCIHYIFIDMNLDSGETQREWKSTKKKFASFSVKCLLVYFRFYVEPHKLSRFYAYRVYFWAFVWNTESVCSSSHFIIFVILNVIRRKRILDYIRDIYSSLLSFCFMRSFRFSFGFLFLCYFIVTGLHKTITINSKVFLFVKQKNHVNSHHMNISKLRFSFPTKT